MQYENSCPPVPGNRPSRTKELRLAGTSQSWLHLQASIYQRASGEFRPGEQNGFSDSPRGGGLQYENGRLTLHYPNFDLDLLHIAGDRWKGRVHRKEFDSEVTLARPGAETSTKREWFVGSWRSTDGPGESCVHIEQQGPSEFIAWADSLLTWGAVRFAPNVGRLLTRWCTMVSSRRSTLPRTGMLKSNSTLMPGVAAPSLLCDPCGERHGNESQLACRRKSSFS